MVDLPVFRLNSDPIERDPSDLTRGNINPIHDNGAHPWEEAMFPQIEDSRDIASRQNRSVAHVIDSRLRKNLVRHPKVKTSRFWPPKLFDHLFHEKDVAYVMDELLRSQSCAIDREYSSEYLAGVICGRGNDQLVYRRLLALLLLVKRPQCILKCISERLADNRLPLDPDSDILEQLELDETEADLLCHYQGRLSVPLFKPPQGSRLGNVHVYHVDLTEDHIQPWDYLDKEPQRTAAEDYALPVPGSESHMLSMSTTSDLGGGFGEVHRIIIHPWQHDFQDILKMWSPNRNIFALKRLFTSDRTKFTNERNQLTRFGGQHGHIVTLLATISCMKNNHPEFFLLFPWAESDLLNYWKRNPRPVRSHSLFSWMVQQCYGIVDAVAFIHDPNVLNPQGARMYGRHGDIKPENILWFQKRQDFGGMGALVLSDLGLAAIHRDQSRSNIPGHAIPATPNYRPPECDMDGENGYVSRSFDIWTLGCLFLEFLVWALDGWKGRNDFRMDRCMSTYLNGETDVYFDIMRTKGERNTAEYFFQVKDQVTKCIVDLHCHPNCTLFIHDFLDLIQNRMLIVQSDEPPVERIKANELRKKLAVLRDNCIRSSNYCMDRCPERAWQRSKQQPYEPVKAKLNKVATETLGSGNRFENLALHSGDSRMAYHQKVDPELA